MANKVYRHPVANREDPTDNVPVQLYDESDGTFAPATRNRLMGWDGTGWVRVRTTAAGALVTDAGGAGADLAARIRVSGATTGAVIVAVASTDIAHVTGVLVTLSAAATLNPDVQVKVGSTDVASHPGVPVGGGFSWSDLDVAGSAGDDITVTSGSPGGSMDVTVTYWLDPV